MWGLLTIFFFLQKFSINLNISIENTGYREEEMVLRILTEMRERES